MPYFSDLVRDTSTTTGTGDVTLAGAPPTGNVAFGTAFTVGQLVAYTIRGQGTSEWETGLAPLSGSTTLQRSSALTVVLSSSNANALVNFSAGTKDVTSALPAYYANSFQTRGRALAQRSLAMQ